LRRFRGALAAVVAAAAEEEEEEEERLPAETDSGRLAGVRAHDCGSEHWGSGSLRARPERRPAATPGRGPYCCSVAAWATRTDQLRNCTWRLTGSAAAACHPPATMAG